MRIAVGLGFTSLQGWLALLLANLLNATLAPTWGFGV